ncbi:MAG: class I SAM-dependent methyltransferase [Bacteroidetes bacterium]|nr:MAG: class I SAM-dependent methyltransferase [Bacteroidota bacterium]
MQQQFWDDRYAETGFAYGTAPNRFLEAELLKLPPGKLLLPGEGEGRNAVFAARNGWTVTAFDISSEGKRKALQWAATNSVSIQYENVSFQDFQAPDEHFDALAFVYTHMPPELRRLFHQSMLRLLKKGGMVILEGFSRAQIGKPSGGPQHPDLLFTSEMLAADFSDLEEIQLEEIDIELDEGKYHKGPASVIRLTGRK